MKKNIIAIAFFDKKIKGTIHFYESPDKIQIDIDLEGFKKNSTHGIHIHEAGDLTGNCLGACSHFNPYNVSHGGIHSKVRHIGDLGNIHADENGCIKTKISDTLIKLRGSKCNIIGRSVVIHEDADDNGIGNFPDSLTTGHSGKRIACAVIGYSKKMFC
jgi:Cu-Zn family superoxide dismutase